MTSTSVRHPVFARFYDRVSVLMDRGGVEDHRRQLLAGLTGRVVEVGAGNGLNFAHYPDEVSSVLAVEPEPYLRTVAQRAAAKASVDIDVVDGTAEQMPAEDEAFDAVVVSLVLCSVPDQMAALNEIRRVLRPGGELRFFEHVRGSGPVLRVVQDVLTATVWPSLFGGCHANRDTARSIADAGFVMQRCHHVRFPEGRLITPTSPHILGSAVRTPVAAEG